MTATEALVWVLLQPVALILAKVTLSIGGAAAVAFALRNRSAALRHFIWTASLAATVVVVALDRVAPQIDVPVRKVVTSVPAARDVAPSTTLAPLAATPAAPVGEKIVGTAVAFDPARGGMPLRSVLIALWVAGMVIVLARYALGHIGLALLSRRSKTVTSAEWNATLASVLEQSAVNAPVRLAVSADVGAPVTWGHRAPVVLIPLDALGWDADRRRVVLLHEIAHIARHDYVVQVVASLVCAMYWFHPLVWMAARRLRSEAERACDDRVLSAGTEGAEYAAHLLDVAKGARTLKLTGAVAIGMARRSTLEGRMLAIIETSRARSPLSSRARRIHGAALALIAITVGIVRPVETRAEIVTSIDVTARTRALPKPAAISTTPVTVAQGRRVSPPVSIPVQTTQQQVADSIFTLSEAASRGGTLDVDIRPGGSVTIHGWNQNRVEVRARMGGRDWRDVTVALRKTSNGVSLLSTVANDRQSMSTSNSFDIYVPGNYNVQVQTGGGSIGIENVEGTFSGGTGGGDIRLVGLSGEATLSTGGGQIAVERSQLNGSVSTGGGSINASGNKGNLRGITGGGQVLGATTTTTTTNEVISAGRAMGFGHTTTSTHTNGGFSGNGMGYNDVVTSTTASGATRITRAAGDVTVESAPLGAVVTTGSGTVSIGSSGGSVNATTGSGSMSIGPVQGSVNATTGSGDVEVAITDANGSDQSVVVTTGTGRVIIEVPRGFSGTIDLETAFTETFGRTPRIISPWTLTQEITPEWDNTRGTPRRYVRASATIGRGAGTIRVRNVNGDVEIRQRQ